MAVFLQAGDKIILAVPDMHPRNTIADDLTNWRAVYGQLGVEIHHLTVVSALTHPVIVAVFRAPEVVVMDADPA